MALEFITPADKQHWLELRSKDLTSTEVPALFGLSPYITKFELFHNKFNGVITEIQETERMGWGNRLERVIGETIIEEQLWTGEPMKDYARDTDLRIGTSFDFFITTEDGPGILEIKNVDQFAFHRSWISDGDNTEAPPHIEIQLQHQMLVSGRKFGVIGALVGGNRLVLIKRQADEGIQNAIIEESKKFWQSITENQAPVPDFQRDAKFISSLYKHAEPGKIIDANEQIETLALAYKKTSDMIKGLEEEKEKQKAMLLEIIQDAEKVKGLNFTISAGIVGPSEVAYTRSAYRNFKVTWKGEKKNV
jgi:putative phage-type endonuclease